MINKAQKLAYLLKKIYNIRIKEIIMIIDEIKKANIDAMKNRDTVSRGIFSVVLNKVKLEEIRKRENGTELVDADLVAILQKTIKELNEEKENYLKANHSDMAEQSAKQIEIISKFLPQMMSKEEIKNIISSLPDQSIPFVMKHFKANYAGKCDMRMVQEVLKGN